MGDQKNCAHPSHFDIARSLLRPYLPHVLLFLQIIALSGFGFFIFHRFIQVVFPSVGWSSCSPLSLSRDTESWIPLGSFSGPSFLALCSNSDSVAPCQFSLSLDRVCDVYVSSFSSVSFVFFTYSIQYSESFLSRSYSSCVLFEYPRLFRLHFLYFLFVWMMSRSILRWEVRSIFHVLL